MNECFPGCGFYSPHENKVAKPRMALGWKKEIKREDQSCYEVALRANETRGQGLPLEDMDVREDEERRGKPS